MTIRIVQVGMGVRGEQWAKVIREDDRTENVAYVRRAVEKGKQTLQEWGEPLGTPVYSSLEDALKETRPDAVVLVTPPEVHHEQTLLSFKYGCHVLCEKPLSEVLDESIDMVRKADENKLLLMVGHNFRYLASSQKMREMMMQKEYGKPSFGHFTYFRNRDGNRKDLNKYPLVMKQPMLLEQSVHHLDLIRYCYNAEAVSVVCDTWRPEWSTYKDDCCVSALIQLDNGMRVNYMGTWTSGWNRFCFEWRTDCSEGVVFQKQQFADLHGVTLTPGLAMEGERFKTGEDVEPLQTIEIEDCEAFVDDTREMLAEFIDAIVDGKPLITSGKDHIKTLGLTLACVEASEQRGWLDMKEYLMSKGVPEEWI
ncbi:MAG: Gfo/Idh/MocA family oxidoreductase [Anaerolineaceae bacterium]|nr:Gfo/Idh/MocA family oxidoreductase [Anaerolineaceae bacterium]